jgi:hypothetical protein
MSVLQWFLNRFSHETASAEVSSVIRSVPIAPVTTTTAQTSSVTPTPGKPFIMNRSLHVNGDITASGDVKAAVAKRKRSKPASKKRTTKRK